MENLIYLLIFVLLPLFEWLARLRRDRAADERRRASRPPPASLPGSTEPARLPSVPPVPPRSRTILEPSRQVAARARAESEPVSSPRQPRARTRQAFRGRSALRRAVIARTVLGPCRAAEPYR
jgi:hypothetical protein